MTETSSQQSYAALRHPGYRVYFVVSALADPGQIYGKIYTTDDEVLEGFIRWDKNEASWDDILDGMDDAIEAADKAKDAAEKAMGGGSSQKQS